MLIRRPYSGVERHCMTLFVNLAHTHRTCIHGVALTPLEIIDPRCEPLLREETELFYNERLFWDIASSFDGGTTCPIIWGAQLNAKSSMHDVLGAIPEHLQFEFLQLYIAGFRQLFLI